MTKHSNKSGIVTRACCSIDETINTTNKRMNNYGIYTLCTVHVMYSPSYVSRAKILKNRQLSHVFMHFIFHSDRLVASHPYSRFPAASIRYVTVSFIFTVGIRIVTTISRP